MRQSGMISTERSTVARIEYRSDLLIQLLTHPIFLHETFELDGSETAYCAYCAYLRISVFPQHRMLSVSGLWRGSYTGEGL